jgi:hypothetical protein
MIYRHILIIGGALVLTACTGLPVGWDGGTQATKPATTPPAAKQPAPAATVTPAPDAVAPAPVVMAPTGTAPSPTASAVEQLLGEAMEHRDQGDIEGAISLAERALRIDPRSPRVYYVLGVLQFDKGEVASASQLARKASALDVGNQYQEPIDRLIAECELATSDDTDW